MKWITKKQRMSNICWRRKSFFTNNFLWLPVEIDGEVQWLCKAKIQWKIYSKKDLFSTNYYWEAYQFIN